MTGRASFAIGGSILMDSNATGSPLVSGAPPRAMTSAASPVLGTTSSTPFSVNTATRGPVSDS